MRKKHRASVLQGAVLGLAAFGLVMLSVGATLYFSGVPLGEFDFNRDQAEQQRYRHSTMTDARIHCEERMQESFVDRIRVMHVDKFSSRHDRSTNQFKIYIEAEIFKDSSREPPVREMFISCFTNAESGLIELFQFAGDSEGQIGSDGEEPTNYFGL
ncbi:hypothetical protein [Gilvimarinus sp. 1_MG-2023]|uniref:hypothetical protein n=1 Tax=Gilvimarinus sp. 1_MG-2023 TaxID=3062638 RepID=UPI0026E2AAA3|nr:hypothetical protein [Gilvimarinus sp. 1_MG-2023]MDO6746581.1 hypothetical protein [Gilvimarinus sp. 1_MG-2023]